MVMITCPQCGQHVLDVASSCPKCGHVLMQNPLETGDGARLASCRRCGKHIERDADRCPFCGYPVRRSRLVRRSVAGLAVVAVVVGGLAMLARKGILPGPPWRSRGGGPAEVATTRHSAPPRPDSPVTAAPLVAVAPAETTARARTDLAPPPPPVMLAAPAPRAEPPLPALSAKWTAEWANVRADRTIESAVIQVLAPGRRVQIADLEGGWWAVYENGVRIGYIANSVLGDAPTRP